eukprot:3128669-Amphidinium_carterae.2
MHKGHKQALLSCLPLQVEEAFMTAIQLQHAAKYQDRHFVERHFMLSSWQTALGQPEVLQLQRPLHQANELCPECVTGSCVVRDGSLPGVKYAQDWLPDCGMSQDARTAHLGNEVTLAQL